MPAAIHPKNLFIAGSFPRIGCLENLDADEIGGFCLGCALSASTEA